MSDNMDECVVCESASNGPQESGTEWSALCHYCERPICAECFDELGLYEDDDFVCEECGY